VIVQSLQAIMRTTGSALPAPPKAVSCTKPGDAGARLAMHWDAADYRAFEPPARLRRRAFADIGGVSRMSIGAAIGVTDRAGAGWPPGP
jgi:hypothetical protein